MQGVISPYGREEVLGWKIQRPRRHEPLKYSLERNGNGHGLECVVHERTDTRTRVSQEGALSCGVSIHMGQMHGEGSKNSQKAP